MEEIAIMFIDGNNWYHNANQIIDVKEIDFLKLADLISKKFDLKIKEVRYYNSIPDISENKLKYHKHMNFLKDLESKDIKVFKRKLQRNSNKEVLKNKEKILDRLDLCNTCKPIVFQNCYNCIGNTSKREKGIDVKIAVDMIRKCLIEKECNICILISGDADFIPAMLTIKDAKKEVITACVFTGYSRELRDGRFRYLYLNEKDLKDKCLKDFKDIKKL